TDRRAAPRHHRRPRPEGRPGRIPGPARQRGRQAASRRSVRPRARLPEAGLITATVSNQEPSIAMRTLPAPLRHLAAACALALVTSAAQAGAQQYEPMAASVRAALHAAVSDAAAPMLPIPDAGERAQWLDEMSRRLHKRIPNEAYRKELLTTIHYEATRAGLDPQMVLGLIQVESNFR